MLSKFRQVTADARDRGASAVEYGLMVAAIAAVIVGIVFGLGTLVGNTFNNTCTAISGGTATAANAAHTPQTGKNCTTP